MNQIMKLRENNEHLRTKTSDVLTFASQRMSELPVWELLRVATVKNAGETCTLTGCGGLRHTWRQFEDFFDTRVLLPQVPADLISYSF